MQTVSSQTPDVGSFRDLDGLTRELGVKDEGRPGPLILLTAGLHGNEPAGIRAIRALLEGLAETHTAGRIVGLAGNLSALRQGLRHQGQDLNRLWTAENLRALGTRDPKDDRPDEAELRALFSAIEAERDEARTHARPLILIDLHSTSADGGGFTVVPDSIPSRRLSRALQLPVVLGLEERIEGPLMTWLVSQGDTATVVEGGQHDAPDTQAILLDALWVALHHAGVLPEDDDRIQPAVERLIAARGKTPAVLDLVYAHPIGHGETFEMRPGWDNFMPVADKEPLARHGALEIDAPLSGYMLMPLYQGLGTEGFFLCRSVSRTWLVTSRLLRRSWIEHFLRILPGVKSLDTRAGLITARRGAPHWLTGLLHLFGYRKNAPIGDITEWSRRPQ